MYKVHYKGNDNDEIILFSFRRDFIKTIDWIALTLVIIGALNWGLIGFFQFDLVSTIFGSFSWISRIIFALVGLSGLYGLSLYGHMDSAQDVRQMKKTS